MDASHDLLLVADQRDADVHQLLQGHLGNVVQVVVSRLEIVKKNNEFRLSF